MHTADRELLIERLGAQGDGVSTDGVFVPLTLPGERVRARVAQGRGDLIEVLQPSEERIAPVSPQYGDCGGCSLQHWAAGPYLHWKQEQVRLVLAREGLETEIAPAFACPPGARRRLALHARPGRGGEAVIGFKARKSWRLVEITHCPVAQPELVRAFPALRALAAGFLDHPKSAPTLHVTSTVSGLDVDVTGVERRRGGGLSADRRMQIAEVASAHDFARVTLAGEILYQARQPVVRFGRAVVALPPGSFLQAVETAEAEMARLAVAAVEGASRVADLFCGAGAFTFPLAERSQVLAADSAAPAIAALRSATGGTPGLKAITAEARDLFRRPVSASELKGCEAIVFDPPRAGAEAQSREIAASSASRVVGVSCNPATFARDARILVDAGFRLERVTPIDQFLWSAHVELVAEFRR
ncbi:MAG: class I SAM-dependent RNA methyltransferase [Caulobacteraceae bacterium]|nr:class I SAM-dependent RNA methyltransferase [Caulobacteraceae bacterium]